MTHVDDQNQGPANILSEQLEDWGDTKRFLYYFRLSPDVKRMLFGGRPRQSWKPALDKARAIRKDMLRVYPNLEKMTMATWFTAFLLELKISNKEALKMLQK